MRITSMKSTRGRTDHQQKLRYATKMVQETQQQDKTTSAYKVMPDNQNAQRKPTGATPWRHMTKRQRKSRRHVNRLTELWPDLSSREALKPLKMGIFDDLMQDLTIRGLAFGPGALRATLASYAQSPCYYRALVAGGACYDLKGQPCGEVTPQEQQDVEARLVALDEERKCQHRAAKGRTGA